MLEFLPEKIKNGLSYINSKGLYELRIRNGFPILVNVFGKYSFLSEYGITKLKEKAIITEQSDIDAIVYSLCNFSVYSVENQIKQGFITGINGERVGIAGEYIYENGQVLTIKNITSLCVRVPHEIRGSGRTICDVLLKDNLINILLMSPPGQGKTTILRDIALTLGEKFVNVLVCDERGEISALGELDCDIIKYAKKETAFETGIRALRPDVIICDELSKNDLLFLDYVIKSGVKLISSAHLTTITKESKFYGYFDKYVLLDENSENRIKRIFDSNLNVERVNDV